MTKNKSDQQESMNSSEPDSGSSITITIDIDPNDFDDPRQMMYKRLVQEYGESHIATLIAANIEETVNERAVQLVNALWDNRDQIAVDDDQPATPEMPDHSEGLDE